MGKAGVMSVKCEYPIDTWGGPVYLSGYFIFWAIIAWVSAMQLQVVDELAIEEPAIQRLSNI